MERKEFEEILKTGNVTEKFLNLSKDEILQIFGNEIENVIDFGNQNNNSHQYALFEHILRAVDNVETKDLSSEDVLKVKIAAFFHDIGKPEVAKLNEKTGQTQFIGHANESASKSVSILEKLGYDSKDIAELTFLIQCHDDFIPIANKNDVNKDRVAKVVASMNKKLDNYKPNINDMKKLIYLCKADVMAQKDIIEKNGEVVDTKEARLEKLDAIEEVMPQAIILNQEQEIEKLEKQKELIKTGPVPIEKNGKIVNQKQIDLWNEKTDDQKNSEIADIEFKINELKVEEKYLLGNNQEEKDVQDLGKESFGSMGKVDEMDAYISSRENELEKDTRDNID